jgi:hypothetical protein
MQKPHFAVKILILSVCTVSKCYVHIQCPFSCCIQCDWNGILELVTRCFDTAVNPFVTRQSPQGKLNYVHIPSCIKGNAFILKKYGVTVKPYSVYLHSGRARFAYIWVICYPNISMLFLSLYVCPDITSN